MLGRCHSFRFGLGTTMAGACSMEFLVFSDLSIELRSFLYLLIAVAPSSSLWGRLWVCRRLLVSSRRERRATVVLHPTARKPGIAGGRETAGSANERKRCEEKGQINPFYTKFDAPSSSTSSDCSRLLQLSPIPAFNTPFLILLPPSTFYLLAS